MYNITPVPRDRIGRPLPNTRHGVFNKQIFHQELRPGPITNKNLVGRYIREWYTQFDVDGQLKAPGALTMSDLSDFGDIPQEILSEILNYTRKFPIHLYMIKFIHKMDRKPRKVGYIATNGSDHGYLNHWNVFPGSKARYIAGDLVKYLAVTQ